MKLSFPEAQAVLAAALPPPSAETRSPLAGLGMRLAEDIVLAAASPAMPVSAMDGVALRASSQPQQLACIGESAPERPWGIPLEPGTCVQILTGASLPVGADSVVPVEDLRSAAGQIQVGACTVGAHVVPVGAAHPAGARLVRGTHLGPGAVERLLSAGIGSLLVDQPPRLRVVPVGDELVAGTVRDSVTPVLAQWMAQDGLEATRWEPVCDRQEDVRSALDGPEPIIITTGGTGPSHRDVISSIGAEPLFDGIHVKPGKPTKAYHLPGNRIWIALPGNPTAALLVFHALVRPCLLSTAGLRSVLPSARLTTPLPAHPDRWRIAPVRLDGRQASPLPEGPSLSTGWWMLADATILLPPGGGLGAGAHVEVQPW